LARHIVDKKVTTAPGQPVACGDSFGISGVCISFPGRAGLEYHLF
jgi:hypothetical protein